MGRHWETASFLRDVYTSSSRPVDRQDVQTGLASSHLTRLDPIVSLWLMEPEKS